MSVEKDSCARAPVISKGIASPRPCRTSPRCATLHSCSFTAAETLCAARILWRCDRRSAAYALMWIWRSQPGMAEGIAGDDAACGSARRLLFIATFTSSPSPGPQRRANRGAESLLFASTATCWQYFWFGSHARPRAARFGHDSQNVSNSRVF